MLQQAFSI